MQIILLSLYSNSLSVRNFQSVWRVDGEVVDRENSGSIPGREKKRLDRLWGLSNLVFLWVPLSLMGTIVAYGYHCRFLRQEVTFLYILCIVVVFLSFQLEFWQANG